MSRPRPPRFGVLVFLLIVGSGGAFAQIGGDLNLPMIEGVLGVPTTGDAPDSGATNVGSDLNLGKPLEGTGTPQGQETTPSLNAEPTPESSISIPQNVGKPPIQPEELSLPEAADKALPTQGTEQLPADPQESKPPYEDTPQGTESVRKKTPSSPDNQISQPADVPSSSLNNMPLPESEVSPPPTGDAPLPSNLLIDPRGSETVQPSEPILDGPPPAIPLLLPESQAPIKSDLFPLSGGSSPRDNDGKGGFLSILGARLGLPGGYLGLRLGGALVSPLAKRFVRLGTYGILAEVRQGSLAGLRLAYDVVPDFRSDVVDQSGSSLMETIVSWRKLHIGWALAYNTRLFFDMFHISPSMGIYGVSATAPLTTDLDGVPEQRSFSVDRVVNFGLEVDAEKIIFGDSILRIWLSRFTTFGAATAITKSSVKDARMTRAGVDLFVKGPKVSRKLNLSYLGFMSLDSMEIVTRDPELLDPMVVVQMPFLGFGTSLAW